MVLNLEKLRDKLERTRNNERENTYQGDPDIWKPEPGEYVIRVLPWDDCPEGEVWKERDFYYNIGRKILTREQFGEKDPVKDLRIKCFQDGSQALKALAAKLFSKTRGYCKMVVRGEEDKGVRLIDMNKTLNIAMTDLIFESVQDDDVIYTDLEKGLDVKIVATSETMEGGNKWTKLTPSIPRSHKAKPAGTKKQMKEWAENYPSVDEKFPCPTEKELKDRVDEWFKNSAGGSSLSTDTSSGKEVDTGSPEPEVQQVATDVDAVFKELEDMESEAS